MPNCLDNWSTAVVDYETFCQIRDHLGRQQLTIAQTSRALALHPRTVAKWADADQFRARAGAPRASKLDAFKAQILRWLDAHPYSAQQIFQRLGEAGFDGGISNAQGLRAPHPPAPPGSVPQAGVRRRRVRPGRLGRMGHHRRGLHAPAPELVPDGAVLQPAHVFGVHRLAADGVLPVLPRERFCHLWRRAQAPHD